MFVVYFTTIVKVIYNLLYYQVVAQISCGLTTSERIKACEGASMTHVDSLNAALTLVNQELGETDLYMDCEEAGCSQEPCVNMIALEQQVTNNEKKC